MRTLLREAATQSGDLLPGNDCLRILIAQWETNVDPVPQRYRIHYSQALGTDLAEFGTAPAPAGER